MWSWVRAGSSDRTDKIDKKTKNAKLSILTMTETAVCHCRYVANQLQSTVRSHNVRQCKSCANYIPDKRTVCVWQPTEGKPLCQFGIHCLSVFVNPVTSYFQTLSKDIFLFPVNLPRPSCPSRLEYLSPRALILLRSWRYILTYLLAYLLTYQLHCVSKKTSHLKTLCVFVKP